MTPTTTGASLRLRDVAIRYPDGSTPVRGTDLDVAAGEIVALVGASGSGKSTILRGIAGLEDVVAGTVELDGRDVAAVPTHRRGVGMVFQDGQLFPHRTVGRNVAYGLESAGWDRARRRARVAELLDLVGLTELTDRPVQRLSGGQAQRVALARSLAPAPRVLLLDEPLSALDADLRRRLAEDIRAVLRAAGTTGVVVTHDLAVVRLISDYVCVMKDGEVVEAASSEEVFTNPRHPYTRRLLASIPGNELGIAVEADGTHV